MGWTRWSFPTWLILWFCDYYYWIPGIFANCYLSYANNCQKLQENCKIHQRMFLKLVFTLVCWFALWFSRVVSEHRRWSLLGYFFVKNHIFKKLSPKTQCWFYFLFFPPNNPTLFSGVEIHPMYNLRLRQIFWCKCPSISVVWINKLCGLRSCHTAQVQSWVTVATSDAERCRTFDYLGLIESPLTNHRH